jgi:hypothetical protein
LCEVTATVRHSAGVSVLYAAGFLYLGLRKRWRLFRPPTHQSCSVSSSRVHVSRLRKYWTQLLITADFHGNYRRWFLTFQCLLSHGWRPPQWQSASFDTWVAPPTPIPSLYYTSFVVATSCQGSLNEKLWIAADFSRSLKGPMRSILLYNPRNHDTRTSLVYCITDSTTSRFELRGCQHAAKGKFSEKMLIPAEKPRYEDEPLQPRFQQFHGTTAA